MDSGVGAVLEVEDIHLSFGGVNALTNVSLKVPAGSIFAVIGPNGAGKTSLLNSIGGFYTPQRGRIFFEGKEITGLSPDRRAALGIARTFQNIALFRGITVLDNIKLGSHVNLDCSLFSAAFFTPSARNEETRLREKIENEVIDFLEIEHLRRKTVGSLAYGLQKRVELARALAMKPKLLLLDEPIAGMNQEETEDMARFILDIKEKGDITIVMIEHNMGVVMDISDYVTVLNFGEKIAEGNPSEIQQNEEVIKAYLGKEKGG